jgi:hypothetical protein
MILCATDLSPSAEAATRLAEWLAERQLHSPLPVVPVHSPVRSQH